MEVLQRSPAARPDDHEAAVEQVLPAAWIGSRNDFNADQVYGAWVDLTRKTREVLTDIRDIIDRTPDGLGQDWDICDTRGLGGWQPADHEGLPVVLQVATGVLAFGEHYGGLASAVGADSPALGYERYQLSYLGSWPSARGFVEQIANDFGWHENLAKLPRSMQSYVAINYRAMQRDAERELTFVNHRDGVWIYDPRVW